MEINTLEILKEYTIKFNNFKFKNKKDIITKRSLDCIETFNINYINSTKIKKDIFKFSIFYTYKIESFDKDITNNEAEVYAIYDTHVNIITSIKDNKIENIYAIDYFDIKKKIDIYYKSYMVSSFDYKNITPSKHIIFNNDIDIQSCKLFNGNNYEKEISDINLIFNKEEIDVIKNNKYGDYDSLLMENLNNIINDYRSNLYDLSSKNFYIVLGDKNNQDIDVYISTEYIDDPVCEEEYASGFFIDFKIRILEDTYLLTYNIRPNEYEDSIYEIYKLDNDIYKSIYKSTFMIDMQSLEYSLTNTAEINYSII